MKSEKIVTLLASIVIWLIGSFVIFLAFSMLSGSLFQGWIGITGFIAAFTIYRRWFQQYNVRKFFVVAGYVGVLFACNWFFWLPLLDQRPVSVVFSLLFQQFLWVLIAAVFGLFFAWLINKLSPRPKC